jgi:hypothetical protein
MSLVCSVVDRVRHSSPFCKDTSVSTFSRKKNMDPSCKVETDNSTQRDVVGGTATQATSLLLLIPSSDDSRSAGYFPMCTSIDRFIRAPRNVHDHPSRRLAASTFVPLPRRRRPSEGPLLSSDVCLPAYTCFAYTYVELTLLSPSFANASSLCKRKEKSRTSTRTATCGW